MDVKEFLDSLSMMCKQGVKTKEFRESERGKKMAEGHIKTFDFDFYDIWYTYTKGNITKYMRDELSYKKLEGSQYASISLERWNSLVRYALECYLREKNFIYERERTLEGNWVSKNGWYLHFRTGDILVNERGVKVNKGFIKEFPTGSSFIIGYKGFINDLNYPNNNYDFNFGEHNSLYWNLNTNKPWIESFYFTPHFKLSSSFMNWDESPVQ